LLRRRGGQLPGGFVEDALFPQGENNEEQRTHCGQADREQ
jgi:hypothetical protein